MYVVRGDVLVLAAAEQRHERSQEPGRVAERPIGVELEFEQVLAEEDDAFGARQHAHVGRQAQLEGVLADQPVAERMEGRDRGVRVAVWRQLVDANGHLVGRLVGEREGQDLRRLGASGGDEPGDPAGDDLGLPRARARHDEQRPVLVCHRAKLVGIEPAQQAVHPVGHRSARDSAGP